MSRTGTIDDRELESSFEQHLNSQLNDKAREISKLIIRKAKWKAIRQMKSAGVLGPNAITKIEKKSIQKDYSDNVAKMLLENRCGCSDLIDKVRKEVIMAALHAYWDRKYHKTENGYSIDPIRFFDSTYREMFEQFSLPIQAGIKKVDPNLYTYYYDAISQARKTGSRQSGVASA